MTKVASTPVPGRTGSRFRRPRVKGTVAMAAAALAGVSALAIFPARTYRAQLRHRADLETELRALTAQSRALEQRTRLLESDEEIERLARSEYGMVRPGEEAYTILPAAPELAPPSPAPGPAEQRPAPSWWRRQWTRLASIF